ncbi:MAG: helix-turn-helix domain-containing protein [Gammaproteobacteria bacterium]|nr:helix-turn-helix domain-containing protein [Gammaproteobacteria bacterium]
MNVTVGWTRAESGPAIMRLAHPLAFAKYLDRIGAPSGRVLRRAGLPALCKDPNEFVRVDRAWTAFDIAANAEDRDIAWRVGRFVHDEQLNGQLLRRIEHAPTLYEGLKNFVRLISSEASHLGLGILEQDNDIVLYNHYPGFENRPGYHMSQGYQLPVYLSVIRHYLGPDWSPDEIGIEAKRVPGVAKSIFRGSLIQSEAPFGFIKIPRNMLATPALKPSKTTDSQLILTESFDFVDTLRAVLTPYIGEGYPPARFAAELVGMSKRTLFRRLAERGTAYHALVDEIRLEKAKYLLHETTKDIGQIARLVGFEDHSHFTRMFRRVSGITPRAYRESFGR